MSVLGFIQKETIVLFVWDNISFHRFGQCITLILVFIVPYLFMLWKRGTLFMSNKRPEPNATTHGLLLPSQPDNSIQSEPIDTKRVFPDRSMWMCPVNTEHQLMWSDTTHTLTVKQNPAMIQVCGIPIVQKIHFQPQQHFCFFFSSGDLQRIHAMDHVYWCVVVLPLDTYDTIHEFWKHWKYCGPTTFANPVVGHDSECTRLRTALGDHRPSQDGFRNRNPIRAGSSSFEFALGWKTEKDATPRGSCLFHIA